MSEIFGFYIYAAVIKIALIGSGTVAIVLGFRLFIAGIGTGDGGDVIADAKALTLRLVKAAPGTCFAVFGAAIIASVAWNAAPVIEFGKPVSGGTPPVAVIRGDERMSIKDYAQALSNEALTLGAAAPLLAGLAEAFIDEGSRDAAAKAYAQLALTVDPNNIRALAAQALASARLGECSEANKMVGRLKELDGVGYQVGETQGAVVALCP